MIGRRVGICKRCHQSVYEGYGNWHTESGGPVHTEILDCLKALGSRVERLERLLLRDDRE